MTRRHDVRRISKRRSYRTHEIAALMGVTKITVYNWISQGLAPIDDHKPYFVHGSTLTRFLAARNKPLVPMKPGQIFCVACKAAREPAGGTVIWIARAETNGDIVGDCPECGRRLFRRVRRDRLQFDLGQLRLLNEDGTDTMFDARHAPRTLAFQESAR